MLTLKEQITAEEAQMAEEEAQFTRQKAELARLWKKAQEEAKQKVEEEARVEEEWKWKEEEVKVEEERKRKEEEKKRADEDQRRKEEEKKRADKEWKRVEEHRKHEISEKQRQKETGHGWETIKVEDDSADEAEWKRRAEVRICEQWVEDQMAQAAQAESSKQATREFARAVLAHWHSRGMAGFNQPYVEVGPIGTNCHVSVFVLSASLSLTVHRIVHLAFLVSGRRRTVSGYPVAGFVPHVLNGKFGACRWTCLSIRNGRVNYSSSQTWKGTGSTG